MQAPQARHIARGGTQGFSFRWRREGPSGEGPAILSEAHRVQRDHVPYEGAGCQLVQPLAAAAEHDVARPQFRPAPYRQWPGLRRKRHERELRPETNISNPWKIFLAPQHLQI